MKRLLKAGSVILVLSCLAVLSLSAQTSTNDPPKGNSDRSGQVLQPPSDAETAGAMPSAGADRPRRANLPLEVQDRLVKFERMREAYLAEQKDLQRRLRGAAEQDRDQLRAQIRERREAWLEQAKAYRRSAQERLDELKEALPGHRDALDAAREQAVDRLKETRERRGSD
jgi:hypothetical protein